VEVGEKSKKSEKKLSSVADELEVEDWEQRELD